MNIIKFKDVRSASAVNSCIITETSEYDTGDMTVMDYIRAEAKAQRWVGVNGIKEFCKEEFGAIIRHSTASDRIGSNRWTSMKFSNTDQFTSFLGRYRYATNTLLQQ
jgi:hypothetical protein